MKATPPRLIFVVAPSAWQAEVLTHRFAGPAGFTVRVFPSSAAALIALEDGVPEILVLAADLPAAPALVQRMRRRAATAPIVVILQTAADETAANALLAAGATEKLPFDTRAAERLWVLAKSTVPLACLPFAAPAPLLLGSSEQMQQVFRLIQKAATANITIALRGETGTGKEEAARAIHRASSRAGGPFVALNMAAIPHELLESELFGHEKGAFTGAVTQRIGLLEQANRGTLFLDEITDLELSLQAKLLRVLQERVLVRVGGLRPIPFDVRLVIASHTDLMEYVRLGTFREDLYYRLLGLSITLPPLRERGNDILLLAYHFLAEFCPPANGGPCQFSPAAEQKLLAHPYPGNVRELRAVVELAAVLAEGHRIEADDLRFPTNEAHQPTWSPADSTLTLREHTARIVQQYLDHYHGNVLVVASRLGIGKSTLYRMLHSGEVHLRPTGAG